MSTRVIMLTDFDYFFAQCEQLRNPSLKDKPVVICVYSGRSKNSGAVSTANYIARRYGVRSGISIALAQKKLSNTEAVFLPVDHDFYGGISGRIMGILKDYADIFEQVGIDEAYMDVTKQVNGDFEEARELAQKMKEQVRIREHITFSVGIGPNKIIAKIASIFQKPDGLTVVRPDEVKGFLGPMPIGRLVGVGKRTEAKMEVLGVKTIGDLAKCDVQRLIEVFGKKIGFYLHSASNGKDESPVHERAEVESISRIATLKENTGNLSAILAITDHLCEGIHEKLIEQGYMFRSVGIISVMKDLRIRSRTETFETPTTNLDILRKTVKGLFADFLSENKLEVRRVGVRVFSLARKQEKQKQITSFLRM